MKKVTFILAVIILIFSANAFGQNQRKKRVNHNLPEVNDEVLVAFRQKKPKRKISKRHKSTRRSKSILQFDEADAIFGKRSKSKKTRRKNK